MARLEKIVSKLAEKLKIKLTAECKRFTPSGFTLIEMLVVIAIIGILAGFLMPAIGKARLKGMTTKTQAVISQLELALGMYENDFGMYPTDDTGTTYENEHEKILELLTGRDDTDSSWPYNTSITDNSNWKGPYLDLKKNDIKSMDGSNFLQDPWGTPYVICVALDRSDSTRPLHNVYGVDIYSLGPDHLTYNNKEYDSNGTTDADPLTNDDEDGDSDSSTNSSDPRHDDINNW